MGVCNEHEGDKELVSSAARTVWEYEVDGDFTRYTFRSLILVPCQVPLRTKASQPVK